MRGTGYADAARFGSGAGYKYPHDHELNVVPQQYGPDDVQEKSYYQPKQSGRERELLTIWQKLRAIIRAENNG
jgi:putative ATPase